MEENSRCYTHYTHGHRRRLLFRFRVILIPSWKLRYDRAISSGTAAEMLILWHRCIAWVGGFILCLLIAYTC